MLPVMKTVFVFVALAAAALQASAASPGTRAGHAKHPAKRNDGRSRAISSPDVPQELVGVVPKHAKQSQHDDEYFHRSAPTLVLHTTPKRGLRHTNTYNGGGGGGGTTNTYNGGGGGGGSSTSDSSSTSSDSLELDQAGGGGAPARDANDADKQTDTLAIVMGVFAGGVGIAGIAAAVVMFIRIRKLKATAHTSTGAAAGATAHSVENPLALL